MQECPRCGAYLKDGERRCPYCSRDLTTAPARSHEQILRGQQTEALSTELLNHLAHVPLLTLQEPPAWEYRPLALVTAQAIIGTGLLSEMASSFADFFGRGSIALRDKLRIGEENCRSALRLDALRVGGHAVIAVQVSYAEVGGSKEMLMVCMAGTAIRLATLDVLEPQAAASVRRAHEHLARASETARS